MVMGNQPIALTFSQASLLSFLYELNDFNADDFIKYYDNDDNK